MSFEGSLSSKIDAFFTDYYERMNRGEEGYDYLETQVKGGEDYIMSRFHEHQRAENLAANPNYYEEDDVLSNDDVDF